LLLDRCLERRRCPHRMGGVDERANRVHGLKVAAGVDRGTSAIFKDCKRAQCLQHLWEDTRAYGFMDSPEAGSRFPMTRAAHSSY
jgi:hypothetical protein